MFSGLLCLEEKSSVTEVRMPTKESDYNSKKAEKLSPQLKLEL